MSARHRAVVGLDVKTLSLHGGGISTSLKAVLPDLLLRTPDFDWVAIGPSAALAQLPVGLRHARVELLDRLGPPRLPVYDQVQLRLAARRERLDLFYSPYFDAPVALGVPTVVTMHDAVHFRYRHLYPRTQRVYYRSLMRMHGTRAAAILTVSEFSKTELVELAGADPRRVHVVPNALPGWFLPSVDGVAVRRRYGLPAEYVLYTGGVEARKNLSCLLEAYGRWREHRRDVPDLVLTGNPGRFASYAAAIDRPGLRSHVTLAGRVADEDLADVYAGARAVIYPSLYEGFGFPILEAWATGVPVACSRRASLPEIGGDGAHYFDPDSTEDVAAALEQVTTDTELRARLVEAGTRRGPRFSVRATAEALARVLISAVSP